MPVRLKSRRRAVAHLLEELTEWARADPAVGAAVLVGSYARGAERMSSDVDVVVLGDTPDALEDAAWFTRLRPGSRLIRSATWGPVRERRFRLRSGLIVELGIAPSSWAEVPLDAGTERVLRDGHRILYDTGVMAHASAAVAQ
ncbi:nucleotidyltransferase domain-containing protein [Arthrobacter sp. RIT-PI-e]|uniref:nucleotidyltransferase domain-containing protein n=1 Tax=Arthrobacter sp. RIT-PI-e TaxID=1681197 RepID=UPI000AD3CCE5|nr:nucleotidyltransferase domain-containing protein [Arthrobacter sp. RIT-PI-e]